MSVLENMSLAAQEGIKNEIMGRSLESNLTLFSDACCKTLDFCQQVISNSSGYLSFWTAAFFILTALLVGLGVGFFVFMPKKEENKYG